MNTWGLFQHETFSPNSKQKGKMKLNIFCSEWIIEIIVSKEEDGNFENIEQSHVPDSTWV